MAPLAWTLRVYWKRYTFGVVASCLAAKFLSKRFRENNIIRAYCNEAKRYGEERVRSPERDGRPHKIRKVMVFLNPTANKRDAKIQFLKYSAPLFFLSGMEVTVVESQYEGHLRTLMSYISPDTDAIVVAGGDGTLMEVVTGLTRRTDQDAVRSIPLGVIPLGRENHFYQSNLSSGSLKTPVRVIGDATMAVIRGEATKPVHLMEIKPESGRVLYALSQLQWGPLRDAYENRDGFKLFGKLRLFFSHLNVAMRRWPVDYVLHVWYPNHCQMEDDTGPAPPSREEREHITSPSHQPLPETLSQQQQQRQQQQLQQQQQLLQQQQQQQRQHQEAQQVASDTHPGLAHNQSLLSRAHCIRQQYGDGSEKRTFSPASDHFEATQLVQVEGGGVGLKHEKMNVIGFHLSLQSGTKEEEGEGWEEEGGKDVERGKAEQVCLRLITWTAGSFDKSEFIQQGWKKTMNHPPSPLPSLSLTSPHLILQPCSHPQSWLSIDGEEYEAMPVSVQAFPSGFRVFTRKSE